MIEFQETIDLLTPIIAGFTATPVPDLQSEAGN